MRPPVSNTYWVRPGALLAGEHPWQGDEAATLSRLGRLQAAGIDCFIDLTEPGERPDYHLLLPDDVRYQRFPLVDHGVPDDNATMTRVVQHLAAQLAEDRGVYLHCRAGIGRTGMAMACHLIASGDAPPQALERLNQLWQMNERARTWPRVPETSRQADYVLRWQPVVEDPAETALQGRRDRFRGMWLGAAVGDALAVPMQDRPAGHVPLPTGMVGGGPFHLPPGAWTDDTAVAACVARGLLQPGGFDGRQTLAQLQRWQREGVGSATGTAVGLRPGLGRALARVGWRRGAVTGSADPRQLDPDPLSRCVAVALRHPDDTRAALRASDDVCGLSHQGVVVRDACRLLTCLLLDALVLREPQSLLGPAARWRQLQLGTELQGLVQAWGGAVEETATRPAAGTILHALDVAVRGALQARDYSSGVLQCVHAGGDADVTAAVCGALLGGLRGEQAIPATWRSTLLQATELRALADGFLQAGR
ncbi:MAG: hypothetical protein RL026_2405 [Pseudomonadota bacterium]|jgi:ADP-ribosyl-[dinitrogen reductase] hydrolase